MNNKLNEEINKSKYYSNNDQIISNESLDLKDELYKTIIEKNKEIKELKIKLARFPFELNEGEKLMTINFTTMDSKIRNYSIICKNTDIFNNLEKKLYEEYKTYYETDNYFYANGHRIHKLKSLEENNIHNNDVIMLNTLEYDNNIVGNL